MRKVGDAPLGKLDKTDPSGRGKSFISPLKDIAVGPARKCMTVFVIVSSSATLNDTLAAKR